MCLCCFIISTSDVGVIERWGKFSRFAQPGFSLICCPFEQLVGKVTFRVQQLQVRIESKTLDNVFVVAVVSVQYLVLRDKVYDAFYALTNPAQQITAHVYDVMRSELPTLELDAVFEAKEELAMAVKNALAEIMAEYGYSIVQVLITDLDPDQRVKNAMNEINSAKRLKYAVLEQAEGDKILQIKSAEAEAEAKYLSGVGVAKQRKAIVEGLRHSIVDFSGAVDGASTKDVMDLLLLTQYYDAIQHIGSSKHCRTTFVPSSLSSGGGASDFRNALLQAKEGSSFEDKKAG